MLPLVPPMSAPVPIAFCITDLDPGGAERALVQIVTRLDRGFWAPAVYCLSKPGDLTDELRQHEIPVTCYGATGWRSLPVVFRLSRDLRGSRPQVLQTFLYHANIAGRLAGRRAGVPHIVSGIRVAERRGRWRLWIERLTERMVETHVCVSKDVAEYSATQGGLRREKIVTIPNGVDYEVFAQAAPADLSAYGIPPGRRCIVSVGRLDPQKAPLALLDGFAEIASRLPDAHLLYVGDGPLRGDIESRARARNLSNRVHFSGRVADVAPLLRGADCFALASRWEGMPNAVLEAMAAGLPVVITRVEGTGELIDSGVTGVLVDGDSAESLGGAIASLLADPEAAREMGRAAQLFVRKEYTWDSVVRQYDRLYRDLLERSPKS